MDAAAPTPTPQVPQPPVSGSPAEASESLCFGPSPRALLQRRVLAALLAALMLACLVWVLGSVFGSWPAWVRWTTAFLLALGLWRLIRAAALRPLAGREVLLREQALELRRGTFRRLVVFANIRHLHTVQSPSGRLWGLRLDLEDDSVTLRDVDGLARIFAAAAQRRPAGVLIEVEERRADWQEPLPWMLLVLGLGLAAGLVVSLF